MEHCDNDWLHFLPAQNNCRSAFTSRGLTAGPVSAYDGFNLCHYTGDDPEHVARCRRLLSLRTGIEPERIIVPTQTHSIRAVEIKDIPVDEGMTEGCDGLVTRLRNVIIGVSTADCVPLVMMDPVREVIGVAHAGWRGALGGIVQSTLSVMTSAGADRDNIRYTLGPSICAECFEVGEEVAGLFPDEVVIRRSELPRPHVDLRAYVISVLEAEGIDRSREIPAGERDLCTRHFPDKFFSARALGAASGRVFTFAYII